MLQNNYSLEGKRVWVAGHRGMVGSAIVRRLARENCEVLTVSRQDTDLLDQSKTVNWMRANKPDLVFLAAAKVGGIIANDRNPADFLYENLMIQSNVIRSSFDTHVEKLIFLGSSCIYPKYAEQPIEESSLLTGPLEPTNEAYAVAKIAGLKLALAYRKQFGRDFISAMPSNLYGPGDHYDLTSSHVLPALIRKIHEAKINNEPEVTIWGTGTPRREFLHADDCADALVHISKHYSEDEHINVGSGEDIEIKSLADLISEVLEFKGTIKTDPTKPDGTPRKLMSVRKLSLLGWRPAMSLKEGIADAYSDFLNL